MPGLGDSVPLHWQSRWQAAHPQAQRFSPTSWDQPDLEDWVAALDAAVASGPDRPLIVAHSLGTITTAVWIRRNPRRACAALFVAPPDAGRAQAPAEITGFAHQAPDPAQIPVAVVASTDDPYAEFDYAVDFAAALGVEVRSIGARGHINADSGLGTWPGGLAELDKLAASAD